MVNLIFFCVWILKGFGFFWWVWLMVKLKLLIMDVKVILDMKNVFDKIELGLLWFKVDVFFWYFFW